MTRVAERVSLWQAVSRLQGQAPVYGKAPVYGSVLRAVCRLQARGRQLGMRTDLPRTSSTRGCGRLGVLEVSRSRTRTELLQDTWLAARAQVLGWEADSLERCCADVRTHTTALQQAARVTA